MHYRVAPASRRRRHSSAGLHGTAEGDKQAQLAVDGNRYGDVPPHDRPRAEHTLQLQDNSAQQGGRQRALRIRGSYHRWSQNK